jgi:hypothetical protein
MSVTEEHKEIARKILVAEGLNASVFPVVLAARLIDAIATALANERASVKTQPTGTHEQQAREVIGTVFDNTACSPEQLKQRGTLRTRPDQYQRNRKRLGGSQARHQRCLSPHQQETHRTLC